MVKKEAGVAISCGHEPHSDEEKWNNPQDGWCEECHMACCRECIKQHLEHKYHIDHFSDDEWEKHVKKIHGYENKFDKNQPTPVQLLTQVISSQDLTDESVRRAVMDRARFLNKDPETLTAKELNAIEDDITGKVKKALKKGDK